MREAGEVNGANTLLVGSCFPRVWGTCREEEEEEEEKEEEEER